MASTVEVRFLGDTKNLDSALQKVQGTTGKTQSALGGLAKGAAGLGVAGAAVSAFRDGFAGLAAEAEATRALEATLTSMGRTEISSDNIAKFASDLQMNSDFIEEDIINAAGVMATFGNIADADLGKANQAAADLAARFNMDLGGATTMLGKALNDPVAGLTAMSRAGVQFTDDQKSMIEGMVEAGDMAGAQKIIFDELALQTTGAAAAQQDGFEKVKDSMSELVEKGVGALMPAITALVENVLTPAIGVLESVPGPVLAIVGVLAGGVGMAWAIGSVSGAITGVLLPALTFLAAHPIVAAVLVIIGVLVFLQQKFDVVGKAADAVGAVFGWLGDKAGAVFGWIGDRVSDFVGGFDAVKNGAKAMANWVIGAYESMGNAGISAINMLIRGYNMVQRSPVGKLIPGGQIGELGKVAVPRFHSGGVVPGSATDETLALLRGGERVVPNGRSTGSTSAPITFVLQVDGREMASVVAKHQGQRGYVAGAA